MNLFDGYSKKVTQVVTGLMGDQAIWIPSDGSNPTGVSGKVLFSNPTKKSKLSDVEYNPFNWQMEYHKDLFVKLKEFVDNGGEEIVSINGSEYWVKSVITKWDGDLSMAALELKEDAL